jgi:hypothetical protein
VFCPPTPPPPPFEYLCLAFQTKMREKDGMGENSFIAAVAEYKMQIIKNGYWS